VQIQEAVATIVRLANLPRVHERVVARAGLTLDRTAYTLLRRIDEEGALRMADLAHSLGVEPSTVSRQVKHLEHGGLVCRSEHPGDARSTVLALTPAGRRALGRLRTARHQAFTELLANWRADDRAHLARLLTHLAADMTASLEQP
jgi:DNA-binding MarR family transcriptional regulator